MPTAELLPTWYLPLVVFLLGAIVGSFCNVVAYRFHTGRSINGRSHCLSCGQQLRWFELIPLVSYLLQRGRCRHCKSWVPTRYLLVEVATGLIFLASYLAAASLVELLLFFGTGALVVVTALYDMDHYVIPDVFTVAFTLLAFGQQAWWWYTGAATLSLVGVSGLAALAASGFFFLLWWLSRGRWLGFGDVKLAFPLALFVGASGAFSFVVLSFWIGAAVSVALLSVLWLWQRGQPGLQSARRPLTMQSAVPFAPFLLASFLAVRLGGVDVLALLTYAPA